jgi:hypothetical protein
MSPLVKRHLLVQSSGRRFSRSPPARARYPRPPPRRRARPVRSVICPAPQPASSTRAPSDLGQARQHGRASGRGPRARSRECGHRRVRGQPLPRLGRGAVEIVFDPVAGGAICGRCHHQSNPRSSKISRSSSGCGRQRLGAVPQRLGQADILLARHDDVLLVRHLEQASSSSAASGGWRPRRACARCA